MRRINDVIPLLAVILATTCAISSLADRQKGEGLTESEQNRFLSSRLKSGDYPTGTFDAWASLLHAFYDVGIHTADGAINDVVLTSAFPDFYSPTMKEVLDAIAWQTNSSWKHAPKTGDWVFARPALANPYVLIVADKWTESKRGICASYRPPNFPVGMDVYWLGSYSAPDANEERELWVRVRDAAAIWFAAKFKRDVSVKEMQKTTVAGDDALYFETPTPRPNVTWRQWAVVHGGRAFVIVSTLPDADKQLLSGVELMVKSFHPIP